VAIEGAWVFAYAKRSDGREPATDWAETRTNDRGAFELAALRPDLPHALIVRHPGHATTIASLPPQTNRTVLDVGTLRLDVGARLEGMVLRDDGTPAAGAFVDLDRVTDLPFIGDSSRGRPDAAASAGGSQSVTIAISKPGADALDIARRETLDPALLRATGSVAGEDGRFRVLDLAPGKYRVLARIGWMRSSPLEIELAPGATASNLRFEIPKGLTLSGAVVDDVDRPLPGAWILLFREGRSLEDRSEVTGADGRFQIEGLEAIRYRLQAGYQATGADGALVHPFARTTLADLVPPTSDLVVRLPRTIRMEGRVVDAEGRPLARAVVNASDQEARTYQAISDAEGRFHLEVAVGAKLNVEGSWRGSEENRTGLRGLQAKLADVEAGLTEILLRLE
jgi:hypothetical protein